MSFDLIQMCVIAAILVWPSNDLYDLCDIRTIEGIEYSEQCDLELPTWHSVPLGSLPAVCYDECNEFCIPDYWNREHTRRRRTLCL
jgi:hypothetical protein